MDLVWLAGPGDAEGVDDCAELAFGDLGWIPVDEVEVPVEHGGDDVGGLWVAGERGDAGDGSVVVDYKGDVAPGGPVGWCGGHGCGYLRSVDAVWMSERSVEDEAAGVISEMADGGRWAEKRGGD